MLASSPEIIKLRESNGVNNVTKKPEYEDPGYRALVEENVKDAEVDIFVHDNMTSAIPATWGVRYGAKNLYMAEGGLTSVEGARKIIEALSRRDAVACLILRHNELGDEGCVKLFEYLCSEGGQRHKVAGILLNANCLGNVALKSVGDFLRDNRWLRELYLASNPFVGDSDIINSFAEALNSSSLEALSLSSCYSLSDAFAERFFSCLDSPHLSNLQLSTIGLTRTAVPRIIEYLSSVRSRRLMTLKLSGNNIGARGAAKIVRSVIQDNFNIVSLEMYGVRTHQGGQDDTNDNSSSETSVTLHGATTGFEEGLRYVLTRNGLLRRHTHAAAFRLLRYSRSLLLEPRRANEDESNRIPFRIQSLPTELQLNILSLTVDTLSTSQRIRIFQFASDPTTLPAMLPDLRRRQSEGVHEPSLLEKSSAPFTLSPRDANRTQWLRAVGCDIYEP
ncbi:RNI-like protein [Thelephora ganbajun]|uniref:RNI-like protein n=1 Tax=Thelephora ganbajun TaxID=370292 RepID=A0ACB6ZSW2_THEGA|nr:RNI-like protein [Thelephora ganbajun]